MGILFAFIASMLTILLGLGFTGLTKRFQLFRGAGSDGPNTRITLPPPGTWEVMDFDEGGLLPWPSEVIDKTAHFQPLPWPSSQWPEPFVTRTEAEMAQRRADAAPQKRHTAPKRSPQPTRKKTKAKKKQPRQQQTTAEDAFFDEKPQVQASAPSGPDPAITPDMVRSWVGMYGLAGAVERYRKTTGREFTVAAKEIAEILRR